MSDGSREGLPYRPCVGVVLARADGTVFAGERVDTPGAWQMPQGGIDAGEEPESAALRELSEETGVAPRLVRIEARTPDWITYDLPEDLVGTLWKGRYRGQTQLWFHARFLGEDRDIDIAQPHREFSRWQWMTPADLEDAIVPFKRATYRAVFDALGLTA